MKCKIIIKLIIVITFIILQSCQLKQNRPNILIIHADEDDCGLVGDEGSLKTGNAGKRIACAIIGYSQDNFI